MSVRRLIFIISLLSFSSVSFCQWKQVLSVLNKPVYTIYFLDLSGPPRIGFVACGDEIWRTSDGGSNWARVASGIPVPSDFAFKDSLIGWVASRKATLNGSVVFKTIDGGMTWSGIPQVPNLYSAEGLYYNSKTNLLLLGSWRIGCWYSLDEGIQWQQISGTSKLGGCGFAFSKDQLNGVMTVGIDPAYINLGHLFTFDGGFTWSLSPSIYECWQPLSLDGTSSFIGLFEAYGNGPKRSDDGGKTWYPINMNVFPSSNFTGDIHGSTCRLYSQTYAEDPADFPGIYRSLDAGINWDYIGGPVLSYYDRRFWSKDRHVFTGDTLGNVFYLYDTVGTPLSARFQFDLTTLVLDTVNQCSEREAWIKFSNTWPCDSVKMAKVTFSGTGGKIYTIESPTDKPRWLLPGATDSILIRFPKGNTGSFTANLKISIKHDNYTQDTIITVKGVRTTSPNATLSTQNLKFDTIQTCTGKELAITIHNTGCDTEMVNIGSQPYSDFIILYPTSDTTLYPGDSLIVRVQLSSNQTGTHLSDFTVNVIPKNFSKETFKISLDGFIEKRIPAPQIFPTTVDFDSISICDSTIKQLSVRLTNRSDCDSLQIDSLWLDGETQLFHSDNLNPFSISKSDSATIIVKFKTGSKGLHTGNLHIRYSDGIVTHDTVITMQGFAYSGKGILSVDQSTLNFGTTSLCAEKDTTFTLRNTGCDTIWIKGYEVSGMGFGVKDSSFFIPPGGSSNIDVHTIIDTTGHATSNSDILTIQSDAENQISPITLTRSFSYPKDYSVRFAINKTSGKNQDQVTMQIIADSLPQGLSQLSANLTIGNTDLLSFIDYTSPNQLSISGNTVTITGNPIKANGNILTELHYKVFLTKDSTTDINFSNVSFNNSDPDYASCVARVQGVGNAGYNYEFRCAEQTIAKLLRGDELRISSINPNPTQGEITITLQSPLKTDGVIEVYDILGKNVFNESRSLTRGLNSILLKTKSLARGRYSVRLKTEKSEVQSAFVKE